MVSVINNVDTSHEDMIHDAQMDYYGIRLATCSSDRSVKIFDVKNGGQILIADLRGHEGPVWQVAWAHPMYGNILASCSYDRKVIIWKEENGTWDKTYEYTGHDSSVNSVCWAPHDFGLMLACGSSDGAISLLTYTGDGPWDVKKISNAHTIGCNAVSWAPSVVPGSLVDQPSGQRPNYIKRFVSGGCDNLVKIWRSPAMMLGKASLCAVVLFCLLWTEDVEGGSSFLSPADMQKNAGKKIPKKLQYNNMGRREAGDSVGDVTDELSEVQEEIGVTIPLGVNMMVTQEQIWRQKAAIENLLLGLLALGSPEDPQEED
ncbi:protein SEC13 homolog isoform X2 [Ranitomeya imitator]|uniref:protein SEC13 homolog isoform X2 n=1 Tax=Ranitomeya imitator TaxID=111125 RepID=UPI0037E8E948